jgi:hypothetical protein
MNNYVMDLYEGEEKGKKNEEGNGERWQLDYDFFIFFLKAFALVGLFVKD